LAPREPAPSNRSSPAPTHAPIALDRAITAHIALALDWCNGRIEGPQGAARLLAINPSTLRSKMRKLGLPR
jgi:transcriptional regulator of acetoin/glycerol metabolism